MSLGSGGLASEIGAARLRILLVKAIGVTIEPRVGQSEYSSPGRASSTSGRGLWCCAEESAGGVRSRWSLTTGHDNTARLQRTTFLAKRDDVVLSPTD